MRLLILGYSSLAERRLIPAAGNTDAISEISVASRSRPEPAGGWPKRGRFFSDYADGIANAGADLIYVSLPNAAHEHWVLAALAQGRHVICDKPALLSVEASERAVTEARRRGLLLAEATVFTYHPHVDALRGFIADAGPLTHVDAQFIIPPLPLANFRNHAQLGGGCLLDMGPYAAALTRLAELGPAERLTVMQGGKHPETGIDTGFSMLARFSGGAMISGHFSFDGEYQNRLLLVARSGSVLTERVFSPPADHAVIWRKRLRNAETTVTFEPTDTFVKFLEAATGAILCGDYERFYYDLLCDAEFRGRLAEAMVRQ